ncbi:putative leucine-rich repeat domain superfamily [Helianthus annuus]|uniref:Leucine-rich repeat domain superfamily n=1 Tax=Helianthus annuus TaxID=4232 RepID=A0A251SMM9_HELAN|nr:putative leucine-rich repeat domain superfamily [Helianthus annuus]KAJ0465623.1 putative leucine-rich repeat domain superfamily [Helianthus annuus]KAJ0470492.1 putative leucine-rich repeat domain superfamily [Helianthus annuus]KAJ0487216.1 putative leucine-rich repeat domain superfamily [Helianthus annuus]KAJ0661330.1 putative leucine-rich repeat domain superfamily [Helianthus annuus]
MWRVINMNDLQGTIAEVSAGKMCKNAVDRSQGQLVDITIGLLMMLIFIYMLLKGIPSQLRRLEIAYQSFYEKLTTVDLMKFPLLEELNLYKIEISKEEIETVGRYCPMLKTLKVNQRGWRMFIADEGTLTRYNEIAMAIGQNLLGIRHLELIGNKRTNVGLRVILDNCHHLETLDLRECFYIDLKGDLGKQCSKQIKYLKLPNDSLKDCPYIFYATFDGDDVLADYCADAYEVSTYE